MTDRTDAVRSKCDFDVSHRSGVGRSKVGELTSEVKIGRMPLNGLANGWPHENGRWIEMKDVFGPLSITALRCTHDVPSTFPPGVFADFRFWLYRLEDSVRGFSQLRHRTLLLKVEIARDQEPALPGGRYRARAAFRPFVDDFVPAPSVAMLPRVVAAAAACVQDSLQSVIDRHARDFRAAGLERIELACWIDRATLCALPRFPIL